MKRDTILFDLDGTLLPMDQHSFAMKWFEGIGQKFRDRVENMQELFETFQKSVHYMIHNDGSRLNEERFWEFFLSRTGGERDDWEEDMLDFYKNEFHLAKGPTWVNPAVAKTIKRLKEQGYDLVVATNPVFPPIGTKTRIRWAGLDPEDFTYITTYDNSRYCKPNVKYYEEIMERLNKSPEQCRMVGNDVGEDMVAEQLGLEGYLITDCLLNPKKLPVDCHWQGSFEQFGELFQA
ncbi:HAD family hydrolase [Anaerolentibacter hominis]|uniref:HAD family hydrolase n=1 Tax=Anaerolentibacter hominis TaxID=3079009 RepID=UPI0031B899E3